MVWDVNVSAKFSDAKTKLLRGQQEEPSPPNRRTQSWWVEYQVSEESRVKDDNRYRQVSSSTGLDPAGPRFVDGPYVDKIPELAENILRKVHIMTVCILHSLILSKHTGGCCLC